MYGGRRATDVLLLLTLLPVLALNPATRLVPEPPPPAVLLALPRVRQLHDSWCVPAAAAVVLGGGDQAALAREMGTRSGARGTRVAALVLALNAHQHRHRYRAAVPASPAELLTRSQQDTRQAVALVLVTDVAHLGYYPAGSTGRHALVVTGYDPGHGGTLLVWDVFDARPHRLPLDTAFRATVAAVW